MNKIKLLIISLLFSLPVQAFDREEQAIISLYEKINPAIVCVDSQVSDGISCGTGCIIDKRGIILTSAHVVDVGKSVIVTMSNGQDYNARVLKRFGEKKDIALLKIDVQIVVDI
jgi:S1-C subfamily serine protease